MTVINNYANIILEESKKKDGQKIYEDLLAIKGAIYFDSKISRFFLSPVNTDLKSKLIKTIGDRYRITSFVIEIVVHMIKQGSVYILPDVVSKYESLTGNRKLIEVSISQKLNKSEEDSVEQLLSSKFGKNLDVKYLLDPKIIGGIVVRFGNILLDGSIKGMLEKSIYKTN